ncbi:plant intracellular Ras-group-related LRR protein 5-like isoform X2 [Zingiber officinale]|uniref:plant intracellular Ras-group-related LRR protein 5-like isoform X2 n=1 Tax=Zingiber officinale TaxID=94328 RepID=UPI001C4C6DC9|nr:plant intracellular Ras-group-related LRR protein 5-like isoform X2 [Zingiber officinale]
MGNPTQSTSVGVIEAVEEIMMAYRSLPPRPSIEEVEAAIAVIRTADSEQELRVWEIAKTQRPPDVPQKLFSLLQEVKRNLALLQSQQHRREAMALVELDKSLQVFDELIQRVSKTVSGEETEEEEEEEKWKEEVNDGIGRSLSLVEKLKDEKKEEANSLSKLDDAYSVNGDTKLSLIQVASLIETSAKKGVRVIDLQGKLMDQIEWLPNSLGKLQEATELKISENRIMALPTSIGSLKCVTKLDIHSNQLINLPESFGELSNLIDLDLHANRLKTLPSTFGNLTNLVNLDLSSNQFYVLPHTIGNLTNLRWLNIETNELEELPYTIGSCTALIELSFNELESIPESLCLVKSLVKLDVGRNFADLRMLPRSIGNLEMLEELDISSNQIRILPDSFSLLAKLRMFNADETPLEMPPKDVIKLGAQAVVQYMADSVRAKTEGSQQAEPKDCLFWLCSLCSTIEEE